MGHTLTPDVRAPEDLPIYTWEQLLLKYMASTPGPVMQKMLSAASGTDEATAVFMYLKVASIIYNGLQSKDVILKHGQDAVLITFADDAWPEGYRIGRMHELSIDNSTAPPVTLYWLLKRDLAPQWYEHQSVLDAEREKLLAANLKYSQIHGIIELP